MGLSCGQYPVRPNPPSAVYGHHGNLQLVTAKADRNQPPSPNVKRARRPKRLNGLMVVGRSVPRKLLLIVLSAGRWRGGPRGTDVGKHR